MDTAAFYLWTQLLPSQRQLLFVLVSGAAAPSLSIQVQLLPLSMWTQLSPLVRKFNRVLYAKRFRNSISSPFPSFLHNSMTTKAVNREDKLSCRYRDRDLAKFERSRRYRER